MNHLCLIVFTSIGHHLGALWHHVSAANIWVKSYLKPLLLSLSTPVITIAQCAPYHTNKKYDLHNHCVEESVKIWVIDPRGHKISA